jgi:hypothetical protein
MKFLCRLGLHAPGADVVSNAGYSFTHCRWCSRDLVRAAGAGWQVPRGHKVVWKTDAEAARDVLLHHRRLRAQQGAANPDLPIQRLLGELYRADFMADEPETRTWDSEIAIGADEARRRLDRSDFMRRRGVDDPSARFVVEPRNAPTRDALGAAKCVVTSQHEMGGEQR